MIRGNKKPWSAKERPFGFPRNPRDRIPTRHTQRTPAHDCAATGPGQECNRRHRRKKSFVFEVCIELQRKIFVRALGA